MGANLKEVRERITSVKSTQQITKAMKMVSASKLRRAQDAITSMRPYAQKLNEILRNIISNADQDEGSAFGQEREIDRVLIVCVTSNRGLAGAFNTNVIKAARALLDSKYADQFSNNKVDILPIGKKGYDFFRKGIPAGNIISDHVALFSDLSFDHIVEVPDMIMDRFLKGGYDAVEVCYGRFKNAAVQYAEAAHFLPVQRSLKKDVEDKLKADYIFEPDQQALLKELIPSILRTQFHSYLLDTHASEHGARMTAMDKATENADELLQDLKLSYNKARQEAITSELSEIVGGAAALEG
ncbi:MAG: ATP synthase F1 subunit gamma [Saprospiraceae bacterium]|nr:ATP synthase F1 subunit gamma [Saprospiraceae bacterium]